MTKLKNILRCYASGMGIKVISSTFQISRNTVRKYVRAFLDSGMSMDHALSLSEDHLYQTLIGYRVVNREKSPKAEELEALLPDYAARLSRDKRLTKKMLYEEYRQSHPDGLGISSFSQYLQRYMLQTKAVVGHVEHYAGDQMYIDYAGDRLEVTDEVSGRVRTVEVFVAILPCSHYTYCEAVWSQRKDDLIKGCEGALRYFGGAPMAIVPDNLKAAVVRADRNEPVIQPDFAAFAEHYGCAVYPARVRHPKDKALVENAVKLIYRSVYADLEGRVFTSLESLNEAMRKSLDGFNARQMAGRKCSRRQQFEQTEAEYLRPLPERPFLMKERRTATVMPNSYFTFNKHHYSVPATYVGRRLDLVCDDSTIEVYHGLRLVTTHHRDDTPYGYTTKPSHNLPSRQGSYEKDLEDVYSSAAQIDNIVVSYLKEAAKAMKYPPKAFRACRGILALERKFGQDRLVAACACAHTAYRFGYMEVLDILNKGDDAPFLPDAEENGPSDAQQIPAHKNIRGSEYYRKAANINPINNKDNGNQQ